MMDEECYVMPAYTSDSPEVQAACDEMNAYLKASITYPMDEDVSSIRILSPSGSHMMMR